MPIEPFNPEKLKSKFDSPKQEIGYLRDRLKEVEKNVSDEKTVENLMKEEVQAYSQYKPEEVMVERAVMPESDRNAIVLDLQPDKHDEKMSELLALIQKRGVSNVIDIVTRMEDPHILDDLHRFLVQYLRAGYELKGFNEKEPVLRTLRRRLFEIVPRDAQKRDDGKTTTKSFKENIASMEQFYSGLLSVISSSFKNEYITMEIANPIERQDFVFFISIPENKADLLEKQIHAFFPDARVIEYKEDFNIFFEGGGVAGAYGVQEHVPPRVLKTMNEFEDDPIKSVLNVFSKLEESSEGAAVQLIFKPIGNFYNKRYESAIKKIEKGEKEPHDIYLKNNASTKFSVGVSKFLSKTTEVIGNVSSGEDKMDMKEDSTNTMLIENIKKKLESPVISTNFRIAASAPSVTRAKDIVNDLASAFNQFQKPTGNSLKFEILKPSLEKMFMKRFVYRMFNPELDMPLNIQEIAAMMHFPSEMNRQNPNLKVSRFASSPAPMTTATEGTLLGINDHGGKQKEIYITEEDRLRHLYTIGQTGTGKSVFLKSLIIQDIQRGDGVCMIDPHGNDIQDVLANVPEHRKDDVVYFDPAYTERPMGLNMLEYDQNNPEQKTFVVNELFGIFQKLYGKVPESMGPMFEQYFRNATMLVIEDPDTGCTLLDVSRVLADRAYRQLKVSRCKNPIIVQFWKEIAEKAGGESSLQNIVPYITSKFDVFLANDIMRPVVAQETSSFNFRDIMDNRKILLVNLSKGRLGDINSNLIGLIVVGKILMAALSRTDSNPKDLAPFYLYIDEFQNITTNSIATILSEARKYKLSLNIAHQFIKQLEEDIKDAVFGNVGSMAVFRVGSEDAEFLEKQLAPVFSAGDIMNIDNYNAYLKVLAKGIPQQPFNVKTMPAPEGDPAMVESLKRMSYEKFGRNRTQVEEDIMDKYKKEEPKEEKPDLPDFSKLGI